MTDNVQLCHSRTLPADVGRLAMPLSRRMWQGYPRQGFDNVERLLVQ